MNKYNAPLRNFLDATENDVVPLSEDDKNVFVTFLLAGLELGESNEENLNILMKGDDNPNVLQMKNIVVAMGKRLFGQGQATMSLSVPLFLSSKIKKIGEWVQWIYTVHVIYHKNDKRMVTLTDLLGEFPNGLPNDDFGQEIWEQQKDKEITFGHNRLDSNLYWIPFFKENESEQEKI